jgi:hypothetical protein
MLVLFFDNNTFVIALDMISKDTDQADEDADAAASEVKTLFDEHFGKGIVRERQRETEILRW